MDLKGIKLKGLPLLIFMQTVWSSRPDLQPLFSYPISEDFIQPSFLDWLINNAPQEYGFEAEVLEEIISKLEKNERKKIFNVATSRDKDDSIENAYKKGINLFAFIRGEFGIGEGGRRTAASIAKTTIDFNIIDLAKNDGLHKETNNTWQNKIKKTLDYDINVFHCNIDGLGKEELSREVLDRRYNIGYWVWELTEFPDKWVHFFDYFNEIWTPSNFSASVISKKANCPVITVPHSIETKTDSKYNRDYFHLPKDKFLFVFMYDILSSTDRKNPKAVIEAFKKAFPNNKNVGLVVKLNNAKYGKEVIEKLDKLKEEIENLYVIEGTLPKIEENSLINCCDVFVSLHRAEGFGLCIAEAMYLGKPVIGTGYSGNTDFMRFDNSCMVKYKKIPVDVTYATVSGENQFWAEADVNDAAKYMVKLYEDRSYYNEIASNGQKTIREEFSDTAVGKIIQNRIKFLRG